MIPNPWDLGSARYLARLGFQAVATTSAGFAWSLGRRDNRVTVEEALIHLDTIARGVDVPVNADFEGGYAIDPSFVETHVAAATTTGIAGLSIEDSSGDADAPLFELSLAVERIRAARRAIDTSESAVLLTARSEGYVVGRPDLAETIRRLVAYADAGADCLYAPGVRTMDEVSAIVDAVSPRPVNVLATGSHFTVDQLANAGVRRISVGGALARAAWTGFMAAAKEIAESGSFARLGSALPSSAIEACFDPSPEVALP